jgi:hypothetical protein
VATDRAAAMAYPTPQDQGDLGHVVIRKSKASTVIANESEAICKEAPERRAAGILPVVFNMGKPGWDTHERHAFADICHGKVDAVRGPAKRDLLTGGGVS